MPRKTKSAAELQAAHVIELADKLQAKLKAIDPALARELLDLVAAFGAVMQARTAAEIAELEREQRALNKEWSRG